MSIKQGKSVMCSYSVVMMMVVNDGLKKKRHAKAQKLDNCPEFW